MLSNIAIFHMVFGIITLATGAIIFLKRKGTKTHKTLGMIYAVSMVLTCVPTFFLFNFTGGFNGLHALSVISLVTIAVSIYAVRSGNIGGKTTHKFCMAFGYLGLLSAAMTQAVSRLNNLPDNILVPSTIVVTMVVGTIVILMNARSHATNR